MRTNQEKYDYYLNLINEHNARQLAAMFPDGFPTEVYAISGLYNLERKPISEVYVSAKFGKMTSPKRENVDRIKTYAEHLPDISPADVRLQCIEKTDKYTSYNSYGYDEVIKGERVAFKAEDLADEIARRKAKYELKEGDVACAYCRKAIPEKDAILYTIIFRMNHQVQRKENKYCSRECGSHDQMAHEG